MYDPQIQGKRLTFGTSGKLYKSTLVMYDRQTNSLWGQILQQAIAGPMTGAKLKMVPAEHTTWASWRDKHPATLVLSPDAGTKRDYGRSPYQKYYESGVPRFRDKHAQSAVEKAANLKPMERVVGIEVAGKHKAYPFVLLRKQDKDKTVADMMNGRKIFVHYDGSSESAYVTDDQGKVIPSMITFWFAWVDFYPDTKVFTE